jgi:DNA polymerase-3 subunit beta
MKFSCTQENLSLGVSLVSRVVARTASLPILGNILIQCQEEGIYLTGTNLELGLRCFIRGKVIEPGEFTVPARLFNDYINLLSGKIDIEVENQTLIINSGLTISKLKGLPANEFPPLPKIENGFRYLCKKENLLQGIEQVVFAASVNETRPELSGVLFKFESQNKTLTLTATDSYRLAEYKILTQDVELEKNFSIIVPSRTLQELARILNFIKNQKDKITLEIEANQISFSYENIELVSRLIDGAYPDYEQIIPKNFKTEIMVNRESLINAIKAASLFSRSGIYDIKIEVIPNKGVKVSSLNAQIGEQITLVEGEVKGEECSIAFNYHYLLDGLQAINTSEVNIQIIDSNNPCLFTPQGENNYLYIVMPIRQ